MPEGKKSEGFPVWEGLGVLLLTLPMEEGSGEGLLAARKQDLQPS